MNANQNPNRLREILRQGDPAAQEPGLTPDEAHAMRRAVLNASPEPRRQMAWFPLMATGAAALLALALAFGPWHRSPAPRPRIQVAAAPTPAVAPTAPSVMTQEPVRISRPAHRHAKRVVRVPKVSPELPIRQAEAPMLVASMPVREIQFSTPGGTRVIWELPSQDVR